MAASSIFEYLTIENPRVTSPLEGKGNTHDRYYFRPRRLLPWEEFNMTVFEGLYDNKLMDEARRQRPTFHIPTIDKIQCQVHNEKTTWHLLEHWVVFTTREALRTVQDTLHPSTWSLSTKPVKEPEARKNKRRSSDMSDYRTKRKDPSRLDVDASTVSMCESCLVRDAQLYKQTKELLPKEVKPYPKFSTAKILPRLDKQGFWKKDEGNVDQEMPIRQAYTYCVRAGCRYGCILSAGEAFIFRIRPLNRPADLSDDQLDEKKIKKVLKNDGLMEYKIIPWKTHRVGDCETFKELTINFSLWVLHILAGNAHEVKWEYDPLHMETLVPQPCPPPSPQLGALTPSMNEAGERDPADRSVPDTPFSSSIAETPSRKRPHENDDDAFAQSFHGNPLLNTRPADFPYLDNQSDTEVGEQDEEDKESEYSAQYALYSKAQEPGSTEEPQQPAMTKEAEPTRPADTSTNTTWRKRLRRDARTKT